MKEVEVSVPHRAGARTETQPPEQGGQAQQMMKEARIELERAALKLDLEDDTSLQEALRSARNALEEFDVSLEQLDQSLPGYVPLELATSLSEQVDAARLLLDTDRQAAASSMHELVLRVTDLTAEADLLIGRPLLGRSGQELGDISNVLITEDGRVQALVVDRQGIGTNRQFAVEWRAVTIRGASLMTELAEDDLLQLPDYVAQ
jgi:sporulation protein YlmC with PRC-barrel domain